MVAIWESNFRVLFHAYTTLDFALNVEFRHVTALFVAFLVSLQAFCFLFYVFDSCHSPLKLLQWWVYVTWHKILGHNYQNQLVPQKKLYSHQQLSVSLTLISQVAINLSLTVLKWTQSKSNILLPWNKGVCGYLIRSRMLEKIRVPKTRTQQSLDYVCKVGVGLLPLSLMEIPPQSRTKKDQPATWQLYSTQQLSLPHID